VFLAAFEAHLYGLLAFAIVGVVLSIYYYFGWIKAAFFSTWQLPASEETPPAAARAVPTIVSKLVLAGLALATVLLGLFQQPLTSWLTLK
jgi:NADH-quinone oxidoreductase subunit N